MKNKSFFAFLLYFFFIFFTYFSIFSTYSFIFFTYSFIFIASRNSGMWRHQGGGGGRMYSPILNLPLGSRAGNFFKSPVHYPEWSFSRMWCHQGVGGGAFANLEIPRRGIKHETCQYLISKQHLSLLREIVHVLATPAPLLRVYQLQLNFCCREKAN